MCFSAYFSFNAAQISDAKRPQSAAVSLEVHIKVIKVHIIVAKIHH